MNHATNYRSQTGYEIAMKVYDRALDNWPVRTERHFVPTSLGDTFVITWGDPSSPPLVLLHGSAANSSTWSGDAEHLGRHYCVHAVDLPGETGKSTPERPPYAGSAYPDWLAEVFDALGIERAAVCGLSLGGWAGLRFAAAHPARVERLVLLAPGGIGPARRSFLAKVIFWRLFGKRGIERITRVVFSPETPPPGVAEAFSFALRHYRERRDNLPLIPDDELRRVVAPVLLLAGAKDALIDMPATAARARRLLPDATVEVDPHAGHAILGKAARIVGFLNEDRARADDTQ